MKEQQNTWKDIVFRPIFLIVLIGLTVRDSFVVSNPRHWLILYLIALMAFGVLMAYKHIILLSYKKLSPKYEKPIMEWATEFRQRPMSIESIAIVFAITVLALAAFNALLLPLLYLILKIGGLFNVLAAF
jgi:hypothetical protein